MVAEELNTTSRLLPLPPLAPPSHVRGGGNDVLFQRALHLLDVEMAPEPAVEHRVRLAPATAVKTTANGGGGEGSLSCTTIADTQKYLHIRSTETDVHSTVICRRPGSATVRADFEVSDP